MLAFMDEGCEAIWLVAMQKKHPTEQTQELHAGQPVAAGEIQPDMNCMRKPNCINRHKME